MAKKRNAVQSSERLLNAAIEVFASRGPHGPTVDEICRKADLNKRMIYHYFGSKERLYEESLRHVYQQFLSLEVMLASMLLPPEQMLKVLVRRYYEFLAEHPSFVRLISYENLNEGRVARRLKLAGQKAPVITALRLALEKGQAAGRFRKGLDVTQLLVSIFGLCFFYFSNQYTMTEFLGGATPGKKDLGGRVDHVVNLLLHGISNEAGPSKAPPKKGKGKSRP